jgi:hypothetical protein
MLKSIDIQIPILTASFETFKYTYTFICPIKKEVKIMAKKNVAGTTGSCGGCWDAKWVGWVALVAGVLWLLQDYGSAPWWRVSWFTLGALIVGLSVVLKK